MSILPQHSSEKGEQVSIDKELRLKSLLPYALAFLPCCTAVVLLIVFAGRGPNGSFNPMTLASRIDAMPEWLHGVLTAALMVFVAVELDFGGRLLAFPIARITGMATRRVS